MRIRQVLPGEQIVRELFRQPVGAIESAEDEQEQQAEFEKFDADDLKYACGETDLQLRLADGSKGAGSGFTAYDAAADREQILADGASIPNSDIQMWEAMADYSRLAGCR